MSAHVRNCNTKLRLFCNYNMGVLQLLGMKKAIIVITGAKLSPAKRQFTGGQEVFYPKLDGVALKMNAAAGVLCQLHDEYEVIISGYQEADAERFEKLGWCQKKDFSVVDLQDISQVRKFVKEVAIRKKELRLPVHIVHYGGASDTKVALPHNSLMAHTWDMPPEALLDLIANNCITLLHLTQEMRRQGIFKDQAVSKIAVISAAAAVRTKPMLGLDSTQKGAGHNLLRNMALDLTPEGIYITEIMPGSTDTGFFDSDFTIETAIEVSKSMGYSYTKESYPVFTAEQIGDAAKYVLGARCNVRELVLLPYGQFPHLGA